MPFAAEMNAFQTEVCGDKGFVAGWDAQDSAVIANANARESSTSFCRGADTGYQLFFGEGQGGSNIAQALVLAGSRFLVAALLGMTRGNVYSLATATGWISSTSTQLVG
jgi:hypothetical protein